MKHRLPLGCSHKAGMPAAWFRCSCAGGQERQRGTREGANLSAVTSLLVCCKVNGWASTSCSAWVLHYITTWKRCSRAYAQLPFFSPRGASQRVVPWRLEERQRHDFTLATPIWPRWPQSLPRHSQRMNCGNGLPQKINFLAQSTSWNIRAEQASMGPF